MVDSTENQDSKRGVDAGVDPARTGRGTADQLDGTREPGNGLGPTVARPRDTTRTNLGMAAFMFAMGYGPWWAVSRAIEHMLGGRFPESLQPWMMALVGFVALCFALSNLGEWISVLAGAGILISFVGGVGLLVTGVVVGLNAPSLDAEPTSHDTTVTSTYTVGDAARDLAPQICSADDQGFSGPEIAEAMIGQGVAPADAAAVVAVALAQYC